MEFRRRHTLLVALFCGVVFGGMGEAAPEEPSGNGDVNGDGTVDLTDAIYILNWRFLGGPEPVDIPAVTLAPTEEELEPGRHRDATFSRAFDLETLDFSTEGRHPYMILEPGYRIVLEGEEDGAAMRVEITVLDEVEQIDGVLTRVVEEREWEDGELAEVSRNFLALSQQGGDIFYFGEDFDDGDFDDGDFDDGDFEEEPWRAGEDGAQAGVLLPGSPIVGARYFTEIAPSIAMDRAEIVAIEESVTVGGESFGPVLVVYETSGIDFDEESVKYYAAGIGLVKDSDLEIVEHGFIEGFTEPAPFESLALVFSVDERAQTADLTMRATAEGGLRSVRVYGSSGRRLVELRSSDGIGGLEPVGLAGLVLGTVGANEELLREVFPEGIYRVEGTDAHGGRLAGETTVSHAFSAAPSLTITRPVPASSIAAVIAWEPVAGAVAYELSLRNEELGFELGSRLGADAACFEVPECLVTPGAEYDLVVGAVSSVGNVALTTTSFLVSDR